MRNTSVIYRLYLVALAMITAAAVTLRTIACFKYLDYSTGYFTDKLLIHISAGLAFGGAVLAVSYIFAERGGRKLIFDFTSSLNYVFAGTLGAALVFAAYRSFTVFKEARDFVNAYKNLYYYASEVSSERIVMVVSLIAAILALCSVFHFASAALGEKLRSTRRADFGLVTVLFFALYAAYLYFSRTLPINSPCKITDETAFLAAAIFFLYETRISIGREKWRRYCAFGMIALLLTAYSAIPSLLVYIFKGGQTISDSIYETLLTLSVFLFVGARLLLTARLTEDREHRTVSILRAAAQIRAEELTPREEEASEPVELPAAEEPDEYYELDFEARTDAELDTSDGMSAHNSES